MVRVGRVVLNGIFKKHTQSVAAPFKSRSPFVPCILFSGTRTIYFRPWLSGRIRCGQVSLRRGTLTIITADYTSCAPSRFRRVLCHAFANPSQKHGPVTTT